jgi:hypothetical protein
MNWRILACPVDHVGSVLPHDNSMFLDRQNPVSSRQRIRI